MAHALAALKQPEGRRAALLVALFGVPLLLGALGALRDGVRRAQDGPLLTLLGEETLARLRAGERTPYHYAGNELLAPDFELPDHRGRPWRLSAHRGKVLILNFWSITCPPCVREMPTLVQLARRLREEGVDAQVVAVSTDAGWEAVRQLFPEEPPLTVLFDPERKVVTERFGTRLLPETWIVDRRGVIRFRYDGALDWSSPVVRELIERYL